MIRPATTTRSQRRSQSAGFTATEVLVAVHIVGIVSAIALGGLGSALDKARVAQSVDGLRGIQAAMWMASDNGNSFPDAETFWSKHHRGARDPRYVVLVGEDLSGDGSFNHGSSEGMGESGGGDHRRRADFVVLAIDDYGDQAEYIFIEDNGPPVVVTGPQNDPGYRKLAPEGFDGETDQGDGSSGGGSGSAPGGGSAGGSGGQEMVGWGGSESPETESTRHGWLAERRQAARPDGFDKSAAGPDSSRGSGDSSSSRIAAN